MAESSILKLIMEKGPREGETFEYPPAAVVKIGRVVRGNTIGIRDVGISTKHICIEFDHELHRWTLSDLESSNGTILNSQILKPYLPAALNDGDCIKIGELTSILLKIGVESTVQSETKPSASAAVVENQGLGLGLGFDGDLGRNEVDKPVEKWNLRPRAKKGVVESMSSKRTLRSSRKEVKEENLIVPIEGKKTRGGRKKKLPVVPPPVDKEREVAEEVEKNIGSDGSKWVDLEKMTLVDFFDCLMVQLPNEIREKSEEIISHIKKNARKCHEFRASKK